MEFKYSLSFFDDGLVVIINELVFFVGFVIFVMVLCDLVFVLIWYVRLKKVFVEC